MGGPTFDVVVVGAGSAGCTLAGRLSERGVRVALLEAGDVVVPADSLPIASLAATAPEHVLNWAYRATLCRDRESVVPRGKILGGSGAINGGYFVRAVPADFDGWAVASWSYDDVLGYYRRSETDLDVGGPRHGDHGPLRVSRPAGRLLAPMTEPFLAACEKLGHRAEPDKNAGGPPGAGPVPTNAVDGHRVSAATAYLPPPWGTAVPRDTLTVRGGRPVDALELGGDRVIGVRAGDDVILADEVVLAAGAVGSPALLMRSGIGPEDTLRTAGVRVHHELPGVGRSWSDHPSVFLPFHAEVGDLHPDAVAGQAALHLDSGADPAGDLEILLFARPFSDGGPAHLMCAVQRPDSRGMLAITSPDPADPPRLDYKYLRTESDRRRMRAAVREAAEIVRVAGWERGGPDGSVLGNDVRLDGWIRDALTTSVHLSGSAAMGTGPDAVVDADLRVHGISGLRVADTSVLPSVPRRGPAATAIMLGERAADLIRSA
ncbi:mycofactocin dehydrogenase MftG [Pseudonocardia endophytica]|uniref:Putative dehydrogenase (TIGR03970 family) n=1 Tax=Pseudonocardia endophytica TaxID=401976 RepID=A0A4R1I1A5_PSEEN|nr:mycofactocin system GMC family oxidoreductase MftG [Pseudonocardia endophytica]TCK27325.1 putative dehydrogenase (TIGR03970 family) [Pseudonocardia endophytica]